MEDESYPVIPSSYMAGSVPAVVDKENKPMDYVAAPEANSQIYPANAAFNQGRGYQSLPSSSDEGGQPSNNFSWQGAFSISSYTQYFNVDTDVVVNRLMSSLDPLSGDFFSKIDANPDLYGLIWVSTTLIFVIASLGNLATYFIEKVNNRSTSWSFNVGYVNLAVGTIYGYAVGVPLAFYFLIQYLGSTANLVRFWCMWGYSLFILVLGTVLLVIPVEFIRWLVILLAGGASACFVASNLRSYVQGNDLTVIFVSAFVLQMALAFFIKIEFFP